MTHTGQCLCGQVRFTIDAEPMFVGMCWCRDCQRIANGSAVVAALFSEAAVSISGVVASYRRSADSGNEIERVFCPTCGTHLFGRTIDADPMIRVRVGALDNPDKFAPQAIIWADSKPGWAVLDEKLPSFPKGPPIAPSSRTSA